MDVIGIVLAAGAGRRMGGPKALAGGWADVPVLEVARRLHRGGCPVVIAVIGAGADAVRAAVDHEPWLHLVEAEDWAEGMGASLRAGLAAAALGGRDTAAGEVRAGVAGKATAGLGGAVAVVVTLVDLPDVGADVVARLLAAAPPGEGVLARAAYRGEPGHPALIGRAWWPRVAELARGEAGARELFGAEAHLLVECGDLATGMDVDAPFGE